jgi:hypothetical protein
MGKEKVMKGNKKHKNKNNSEIPPMTFQGNQKGMLYAVIVRTQPSYGTLRLLEL